MAYLFRWKARPDIADLERNLDELRTTIIRLRHQLHGKDQFINRLKFLVQERMTRIDDQRGRIEQLQERNQALDQKAEHYATLLSRDG